MKLLRWILCNIIEDHEWTCKAQEGILPDRDRVAEDYQEYFREYSKSYCKYCGKILKYSAKKHKRIIRVLL